MTNNKKKIKRYENEIRKLKSKRDFLSPRITKSRFLGRDRTEIISVDRLAEIERISARIVTLETIVESLKVDHSPLNEIQESLVEKLVYEYLDFTKNTKDGFSEYTLMMFLQSLSEIPDNQSLLLFVEKVS